MSLIKKNKTTVILNGFVLKNTKVITQTDTESDHAWAIVAGEYAENQNGTWLEKAQCSLINSIVYHRKAAFILTRDNFGTICREDKNWKKKIGFRHENWKIFLYEASGLIAKVKEVKNPKSGRKIYIYQVILPELLSLLNVNLSEQITNCEKFIKNNMLQDGTEDGTKIGDVEIEIEIEKDEDKNLDSDLALEEKPKSDNPNSESLAEKTFKTSSSNSKSTSNPLADDENKPLANEYNYRAWIEEYTIESRLEYLLNSKHFPFKYYEKCFSILGLVQNGNKLSDKQLKMVNDWFIKTAEKDEKEARGKK